MSDLFYRMHSGVGASGAYQLDGMVGDEAER
jgi:hypothetical protein